MDNFDALANRLEIYARRWKIEFSGRKIETPSSTLVFDELAGSHMPVVLKILKPGSDEHNAWRWLEYHAGQGAVGLLDKGDAAGVMLLERVFPGTGLAELVKAGQDAEATRHLCQTIELLDGDLHAGKAIPGGFKTVEEWGQAFGRNSRALLTSKIPAQLLDQAHRLYNELCRSQGPRHLLHGDLHHYNVLLDTHQGWRAIDPKGIVGEMAYETGAMLRNPIEMPEFFTDPVVLKDRVGIICQKLGLEEKRVLGWCFAQAILSAIWWIEDAGPEANITHDLRLAESSWRLLQGL